MKIDARRFACYPEKVAKQFGKTLGTPRVFAFGAVEFFDIRRCSRPEPQAGSVERQMPLVKPAGCGWYASTQRRLLGQHNVVVRIRGEIDSQIDLAPR